MSKNLQIVPNVCFAAAEAEVKQASKMSSRKHWFAKCRQIAKRHLYCYQTNVASQLLIELRKGGQEMHCDIL